MLICCFSPMLICATFGFRSLRTWANERMGGGEVTLVQPVEAFLVVIVLI